jgi:hypothetical protein
MSLTSSNPQKDTIRNDLLVCPWVRSQDLCGSEAFDDDHANGLPRLPPCKRSTTAYQPSSARRRHTHLLDRSDPHRYRFVASAAAANNLFITMGKEKIHISLVVIGHVDAGTFVSSNRGRKASVSRSRIVKGKMRMQHRGAFVRLDRWAAYPCRLIAAIDIPKRITMGIVRAVLIRSIDIGRSVIHQCTIGCMSQGAVRNLSLYFLPVRHLN